MLENYEDICMMDLTEARKMLGVDENTPKEEINKRYEILLKRYKTSDVVDGISVIDLNNAFSAIMGYDLSDDPSMHTEPSSFSKFIGKIFKIDAKKVDNFFNYNTTKIIIAIVSVIILSSLIKEVVLSKPTDLYLNSIGDITISQPIQVEENLKKIIPTLGKPSVEALYIGKNNQGDQEYSMVTKASLMLAAGDMDIILVDADYYENFAYQGAFVSVDEISKELGITLPKDEALLTKTSEGQKDVFGVDVTNSEFLKENGIQGEKVIATIRVNPKHGKDALQIYKLIYDSIKK